MIAPEEPTFVSGEAKARQRKRRVWAAMLVPAVIGVAILQAAKFALGSPAVQFGQPMDPAFALVVAIVLVGITVFAAIWHHRVIDEQEEHMVLWANTAGFYSLIMGSMVAEVLAMGGWIAPIGHVALMLVCCLPALATYAWLRFR